MTVITRCHVIKNGADILYVFHDAEDGMCQFLCGKCHKEKEARVVSLNEVFTLDNTVLELENMPSGYIAERKSKNSKWTIKNR